MTAASRRSILTALAAVPAVGVPALDDVADTSEPDPVFSLIDAARLALEALNEALEIENAIEEEAIAARRAKYGGAPWPRDLEDECPPLKAAQEKIDALGTIQCDAEDAVLDAKPRTLAGVAAQLICAAERYSVNEKDEYFLPLLVNAARMIDSAVVSKIGLSEQLAGRLSEDQAEIES
jgi:hypothetical protein